MFLNFFSDDQQNERSLISKAVWDLDNIFIYLTDGIRGITTFNDTLIVVVERIQEFLYRIARIKMCGGKQKLNQKKGGEGGKKVFIYL